jgi:GTP-binding protein EngB required for normal cell division
MIIEACQTFETVKDIHGNESKQLALNPKKVWYKTHIVNYPGFGRYVLFREMLEDLASQAFYHMSRERAVVLANQIMDICESYDYSIDAKSSEILRDKNNTQSNLIDKINRNKIERQYTIKDEMKKGILDGFLGKKANQDAHNES